MVLGAQVFDDYVDRRTYYVAELARQIEQKKEIEKKKSLRSKPIKISNFTKFNKKISQDLSDLIFNIDLI
jgi:hypothetical protein